MQRWCLRSCAYNIFHEIKKETRRNIKKPKQKGSKNAKLGKKCLKNGKILRGKNLKKQAFFREKPRIAKRNSQKKQPKEIS